MIILGRFNRVSEMTHGRRTTQDKNNSLINELASPTNKTQSGFKDNFFQMNKSQLKADMIFKENKVG